MVLERYLTIGCVSKGRSACVQSSSSSLWGDKAKSCIVIKMKAIGEKALMHRRANWLLEWRGFT